MGSRKPLESVERISMPSRASFEKEYVEPCRPVIITGGMTRWKALSKWSEEFFRTSPVSERTVPVEWYRDSNRFMYPVWTLRHMSEMSLRDYVDLALSERGTEYYLADQDIEWGLPELLGDVEYPALFDRSLLRRTTLYMGRDTISAAHYHPDTQVISCQVKGRKRFVFFAPEDSARLYPLPWYVPNFNWSRVNFDAHDARERFPMLEGARRIECTIEPGDMLFVPVHWWHLVYGERFSVSAVYIWSARLRDWPFPRPALRTVAAAMVNNSLVTPLVPGQIRQAIERAVWR